jgi:hypothetical protein
MFGSACTATGSANRQLCGPTDADSSPTWIVIACRRYLLNAV